MKIRKSNYIIILFISIILMSGCKNSSISLSNILDMDIEDKDNTSSYYMEEENSMEYKDIANISSHISSKIWVKNGRYRIESNSKDYGKTVELYNGEYNYIYNNLNNQIQQTDDIDESLLYRNNLEETKGYLKAYIEDGYDLKELDEESVEGWDTICIKGRSKEYGSVKLYIDNDSYMIVKHIIENDSFKETRSVKVFNRDIDIDDNRFILEYPKDIDYISLEDMHREEKGKELTLKELPENILYLPEDKRIKRVELKNIDYEGDRKTKNVKDENSISQIYMKDGKNYINIRTFQVDDKYKNDPLTSGYTIQVDDKKVYRYDDEFNNDLISINYKGINHMIHIYKEDLIDKDIINIVKSLKTND